MQVVSDLKTKIGNVLHVRVWHSSESVLAIGTPRSLVAQTISACPKYFLHKIKEKCVL